MLAAYRSDDSVGEQECWAILLTSLPLVFGVVALYLAYSIVASWHSIMALLMTFYFFPKKEEFRKTDVVTNASKVVGIFKAQEDGDP